MSKDSELYKKLSNWRMGTIKSLHDECKWFEMFRFMEQEMSIPEKPENYNIQESFDRRLRWNDPSTPIETIDFIVNLIKSLAIGGPNIDMLFEIPYSMECFSRFWGMTMDSSRIQPAYHRYVQPKPLLNVADIAGPNDWPNVPHKLTQGGVDYTLLKTGRYWKHAN